MKQDFLFELGCEELPAGQINTLLTALEQGFVKQLESYRLEFGEIDLFGTPRRLALRIHDLAAATPAQTIERRGPSKAQGFDSAGQPSKALLGFLQSAQAKLDDLIEVATDKGVWLAVKVHKPAQTIQDLLPVMVTEVIKSLPLKKSMRWGNNHFNFLRPVHWVLMMYGKEVVPAEVFGIPAGNFTFGHRFTHPQAIKILEAKEYEKKLFKANVVADPVERKQIIEQDARALAGKNDQVRFNTLTEVVNLVEWPKAVLCEFKPEFLKVPKEVLISAMETHQRVFPILDHNGHLKAQFIAISNNAGDDLSEIKLGNEKVISARLSDAEFFYLSDAKVPLQNHLDALKKISFQEKIGSLFDKVERIKILANYLAEQFNAPKAEVEMAAQLCKCDLITDMVQEFPELQGIMGRQYALVQGMKQEVAYAIEDHYKPKGRGGDLPRQALGGIIAISDKIDTLVGLFGIGEKPTGSGDPYALRRQAIGIIEILIHFNWSLDLVQLTKKSYAAFEAQTFKLEKWTSLESDLIDFLIERIGQWSVDLGVPANVVNAIKVWTRENPNFGLNPVIFYENVKALTLILEKSDGQVLLNLVKRAKNILPEQKVNANYKDLTEAAEKKLISVYESMATKIPELIKQQKFLQAYELLLDFKAPLEHFFDQIKVMDDNVELRNKRLALLSAIFSLFQLLADFNCL